MQVTVVTDSTAYLPEGFAVRHSITTVPLYVLIDGEEGLDGVDVDQGELVDALKAKRKVTTSMPSPVSFSKAYREALDNGADMVVSVHISSELSGTWGAAVAAADEVNAERGEGSVRVVDSRTTVMGLGFAAVRAADVATRGATGAEVEAAAVSAAARSRTLFVVETLEHLRRGGRIGAATAVLGTALAMKPLLHIDDGKIKPLEKVRTLSRAMTRLADLAVEAAGDQQVEVAVQHLGAHERAARLAEQLEKRIPGATGCVVAELGAVIGAHTGPGVVGVVVQPV
ncbi:DegV family protein [Haloechinothrix halophila]|uniref:DegV family protein n=1 Tax=Haloechinothrix halophila TaxID=1069073 RepID=UPI00041051CB|nr:DegV family protein [Haloechinothrix halophila]